MKLGRDEILMVPYKRCCFSARSAKGRIQGGAKIGHGGPLLQETSSSDWKATTTNQRLILMQFLFLCGKVFNLHLFCVISMFVSGRMLRIITAFNSLRFLMIFYVLIKVREGGINACIFMGTHSQPLPQNRSMVVNETW